jgi:hypothetical protein
VVCRVCSRACVCQLRMKLPPARNQESPTTTPYIQAKNLNHYVLGQQCQCGMSGVPVHAGDVWAMFASDVCLSVWQVFMPVCLVHHVGDRSRWCMHVLQCVPVAYGHLMLHDSNEWRVTGRFAIVSRYAKLCQRMLMSRYTSASVLCRCALVHGCCVCGYV